MTHHLSPGRNNVKGNRAGNRQTTRSVVDIRVCECGDCDCDGTEIERRGYGDQQMVQQSPGVVCGCCAWVRVSSCTAVGLLVLPVVRLRIEKPLRFVVDRAADCAGGELDSRLTVPLVLPPAALALILDLLPKEALSYLPAASAVAPSVACASADASAAENLE